MKKLFIIIIMVIAFISISGCTTNSSVTTSPIPNPESLGNGVLYFHGIQGDAGFAISNYIKENPQLHVVAMASDDTGIYGHTVGYFVIVENRTCENEKI